MTDMTFALTGGYQVILVSSRCCSICHTKTLANPNPNPNPNTVFYVSQNLHLISVCHQHTLDTHLAADFREDHLGADDLALAPPDGDTDADVEHGEKGDGDEEEGEEEEVVDGRVDGTPHRVFRGAVTGRQHPLFSVRGAVTQVVPQSEAVLDAVAMTLRVTRSGLHVQEEGLAAEEETGGPGGEDAQHDGHETQKLGLANAEVLAQFADPEVTVKGNL